MLDNTLVYYTTSVFSLAKIILYIFDMKLETIESTKLFYFLKRCLKIKPEQRSILYV